MVGMHEELYSYKAYRRNGRYARRTLFVQKHIAVVAGMHDKLYSHNPNSPLARKK